jgi:hypothetical protein
MTHNPADKIRKLLALYNDPSSTEGERAGCLAAIERVKLSTPPEVFAAASEEAKQKTSDEEFLKRAKGRRQRREAGWQAYQEQNRHRDFMRDQVNAFQRRTVEFVFSPEFNQGRTFDQQDTKSMRDAYPKAYGDRRK